MKAQTLTRLRKHAPIWTAGIVRKGIKGLAERVSENKDYIIKQFVVYDKHSKKTYNLGNYACCIVGEHHGFSDDYAFAGNKKSCVSCKYSSELILDAGLAENWDLMEKQIVKFLDHFEKYYH